VSIKSITIQVTDRPTSHHRLYPHSPDGDTSHSLLTWTSDLGLAQFRPKFNHCRSILKASRHTNKHSNKETHIGKNNLSATVSEQQQVQ